MRTLRVLIADDEPDALALVELVLISMGHTVDLVMDGAAALARCRTGSYDAAVLDVEMPGMSGLEVIATLRGISVTAQMLLVLVSTLDKHADVARALAAGADNYIVKPFHPDTLRDCFVNGRLDGRLDGRLG